MALMHTRLISNEVAPTLSSDLQPQQGSFADVDGHPVVIVNTFTRRGKPFVDVAPLQSLDDGAWVPGMVKSSPRERVVDVGFHFEISHACSKRKGVKPQRFRYVRKVSQPQRCVDFEPTVGPALCLTRHAAAATVTQETFLTGAGTHLCADSQTLLHPVPDATLLKSRVAPLLRSLPYRMWHGLLDILYIITFALICHARLSGL